jgi:hypothetical protein
MGRKLVRENELLQPGGLLSFPRTGCALRAPQSYHQGREPGNPVAPTSSPEERGGRTTQANHNQSAHVW